MKYSKFRKVCAFSFLLLALSLLLAEARTQPKSGKLRSVYVALDNLPPFPQKQNNRLQKYQVSSCLTNRDISGNILSYIMTTANYSRNPADSSFKWNHVRIGTANPPQKEVADNSLTPYPEMENFTYRLSPDIVNEEFFNKFPNDDRKQLIKMLVWDAALFEPSFWQHFDQMKLNEVIVVGNFKDQEILMGNFGAIKMKDLKFQWSGISKRNNELCALLQFRSFANPVRSDQEGMVISGRSLYWGDLWISLIDGDLEYGTLYEDFMMQMQITNVPSAQILDIQREVRFEKSE
ncbi:MAG: hypothetical protein V1681_03895 [Candidatus Neomarinimicrobiota bacterium]